MLRLVPIAIALLALQVLPTGSGLAETPGRHPSYLHARSDLRAAQALMREHVEPNVRPQLHAADQAVERAIHELDKASVLDRKDLNDHPAVDAHLDQPSRLRQAYKLLQSARQDISHDEDNARAVGWRNIAGRHIDLAIEHLRRAAQTLRMDHLEDH